MKKQRTIPATISAGSMADIAFLLLIFFLVTTTIVDDKGLILNLPPKQNETTIARIHDRNLFKIQINSMDKIMIQGEVRTDLSGLREEVKEFILNPASLPSLAESPKEAVISLQTNRGTSYRTYIFVLDELHGAYYEIYGDRVNMSAKEFRKLDTSDPAQRKVYEKAKKDVPMNISIAEPAS